MKRKIIIIASIVILAAVFGGILILMLISKSPVSSATSDVLDVSGTTTKPQVQVPNIIEETETESSVTTKTGTRPTTNNQVKTDDIQSRATYPANGKPKDMPPDDDS